MSAVPAFFLFGPQRVNLIFLFTNVREPKMSGKSMLCVHRLTSWRYLQPRILNNISRITNSRTWAIAGRTFLSSDSTSGGDSKEDLNLKNEEAKKHPDAESEPLPEWPDGVNPHTGERGGPRGPEPTRYGDWERKGRVSDF